MNWKEKLSESESLLGTHVKSDWKPITAYIQNLIEEMPNEVEVIIRAIYILHNILVEEEYTDDHGHINDLNYSKEITVSLYEQDKTDGFNDRIKKLIIDNK